MLNMNDFIHGPKMHASWLYAEDVVNHILTNNSPKETHFKNVFISDFNDTKERTIKRLQEAMNNPFVPESSKISAIDDEIFEHYEVPKTRERFSDMGDLDIDRYLEGHDRPFNEPIKIDTEKQSVTIIFECNVPSGDREKTYVIERYYEVYRYCMQCEALDIPYRVVIAKSNRIPERLTNPVWYMVLKDYDTPIFHGLWSILQNNALANDFSCLFMHCVVGTGDTYAGTPSPYNMSNDFDLNTEQVILINPKHFSI